MSKREKLIGGIFLSVAILWAMASRPNNSLPKKSVAQSAEAHHDNPISVLHPEESQPLELKRVLEQLQLRSRQETETTEVRDPFKKFDQKELMDKTLLDFSELVLTGIVMEGAQPGALINDQILKQGDKISGFEVKEIRSNEVVLTRGLEKYTLKLFTEP